MHAQHSTAAREAASNTQPTKLPPSFLNFGVMPDEAFVRLPTVVLLDASSPASIWRKVRNGIFPAPVKLGEKATAWNVGALRRHYAALIAKSAGGDHAAA